MASVRADGSIPLALSRASARCSKKRRTPFGTLDEFRALQQRFGAEAVQQHTERRFGGVQCFLIKEAGHPLSEREWVVFRRLALVGAMARQPDPPTQLRQEHCLIVRGAVLSGFTTAIFVPGRQIRLPRGGDPGPVDRRAQLQAPPRRQRRHTLIQQARRHMVGSRQCHQHIRIRHQGTWQAFVLIG